MLGATLLTWAGLLTSAASLPQQEEVAVEQEAKFTSPPVRLMVNQGSSFRLPCTVEDIGAFILLWKAGGTILSVGERVVVDQTGGLGSRLSLHQEGQALLVKDAIPEDAGEYTCQVSDYRPKELRHHVIVRTRPSVRVLTPSLTVGQGENASLQCEVAGGSPEPELSWARPGHSISTSQSPRLELSGVTWREAGWWECRADNGHSEAGAGRAQLVVTHPPVLLGPAWVHSSLGGEAELQCGARAEPAANLTWLAEDGAVMGTEDILTVLTDPANSTLLERTFTCLAENELGKAQLAVVLTSRPGQPELWITSEGRLAFNVTSDLAVARFQVEVEREGRVGEMETLPAVAGTLAGVATVEGASRVRVRAENSHGLGPASDWLQLVDGTASCAGGPWLGTRLSLLGAMFYRVLS